MSIKSKLFHFVNRIVTIKEQSYSDMIKYDSDNLFPQNLIRKISESVTATGCIDILNQYIYADGLVDTDLGKVKLNETLTANQFIKKLVPYVSNFQAFAVHVSRNIDGSISSLKPIPFEYIRKRTDGTFVYNPTFSLFERYNSDKDVVYPAYKGTVISKEQLAEHIKIYGTEIGEIFYFFNEKPCQYIYPIPTFHSAISDIETDAEHSKYELETVNNSFLPSGILTMVGEIDTENKDEDGRTEYDDLNDNLAAFTGSVKDKHGETGRNKLLVLHAKTKEEIPQYTPLNNEGILTAIDTATKRVSEKVARAFGVPPFLIGLGGNVGFATNIIADNVILFNNRVSVLQDIITQGMEKLIPEKNWQLTQFTPIKYLAPEILATLTETEKRQLAGYKPKIENANLQTTNN